MKSKSTSHERSIKGYLRPKHYSVIMGMCKAEHISMSKVLNIVCSEYVNKLDETKRTDYLKSFHTLKSVPQCEAKKKSSKNSY
jgi:hypothetical protein